MSILRSGRRREARSSPHDPADGIIRMQLRCVAALRAASAHDCGIRDTRDSRALAHMPGFASTLRHACMRDARDDVRSSCDYLHSLDEIRRCMAILSERRGESWRARSEGCEAIARALARAGLNRERRAYLREIRNARETAKPCA
ncbi:hypothetical protein [Lysobacter sp. Root690]|uniref:hypothetical protein n=1 Tax=Lysobacter sp. Root690 TaxID=1736588 RepID=UPI0012F7B6BB|nr:hypothetical protein [Lysobacter sp. Root690]